MLEMNSNPLISGFTTNPTLVCKAGITNYLTFAREIVSLIPDKPISFEVFSDDFSTMEEEAKILSTLGKNVYVKLPITNTKGESCFDLAERLSSRGVKLNITAVMTCSQVAQILPALRTSPQAIISVFAGRIADTGLDPIPTMKGSLSLLKQYPQVELLWASTRELLNIVQANEINCHIITVTNDIIKKLFLIGKDLLEFSLETVKMFYEDAKKASAVHILENLSIPNSATNLEIRQGGSSEFLVGASDHCREARRE
jgi:transaldolase